MSSILKLLTKFDPDKLLNDFESLPETNWSSTHPTLQMSLQFNPHNCTNMFTDSCGSLQAHRIENEFDTFLPFFNNSYTQEILNSLSPNLFRARYMRLLPKSCYSVHEDNSWRLHIPLSTNPNCYFLFFDQPEFIRLEVGSAYLVNTTRPHTYINGGTTERLHIVASIDGATQEDLAKALQ